jgi:Arc/MetJ-type ribon-helix-helix transcriptional regulator
VEENPSFSSLDTARRPGRRENNVKSEQITLTLSPGLRDKLEELTDSGYYGKNAADTASMLLWKALQEAASQCARELESLKALSEYRASRITKSKMNRIASILQEDT